MSESQRHDPAAPHPVRSAREAKHWTQTQLAERSGVPRSTLAGLEAGRVTPSVTAALALAKALGCPVEALFEPPDPVETAWLEQTPSCAARVWSVRVGSRRIWVPWEPSACGPEATLAWDGQAMRPGRGLTSGPVGEAGTLLATCDPFASMLSGGVRRRFQGPEASGGLVSISRPSGEALGLLGAERVHAAGVHFASQKQWHANARRVKLALGKGYTVLSVARWEEGVATRPDLGVRTVYGLRRVKARWVGRQATAAAGELMQDVGRKRKNVVGAATDHWEVAAAIRGGFADAGVCLEAVARMTGLGFIPVRSELYAIVFSTARAEDPAIRALLAAIHEPGYCEHLSDLPGIQWIADASEALTRT